MTRRSWQRIAITLTALCVVVAFGAWYLVRPVAHVSYRAAAPLTAPVVGPSQAQLSAADTNGGDWLYATHDYSGQRFSPLVDITPANVTRLRRVCTYDVGEPPSFQAHPIVYQGTMYLTTAEATIALDAATCRERWRRDRVLRVPALWATNRGAAIKDGLLVRGTHDGYLMALDAATGALRWERRVADRTLGEAFTMPPLIHGDLVFIAPAGSESRVSGWVGAFRLRDGSEVWRFHTVPGAKARTSPTWRVPDSVDVGGGAVWTPMTFDQEGGLLYVPVTNPAPDLIGEVREGDNLYTNSVVALNAKTGTLAWYHQVLPHDTHDWDLTHAGPLFQLDSAKRIASVGKDGVLHVIDRTTHSVVFRAPVTRQQDVRATITLDGTYACPGIHGGVLYNGPAYSPVTRTLYVPSIEYCGVYTRARELRDLPGMGGTFQGDSTTWGGWLTAIDASSGAVRWRYRSTDPMLAAVTVTASGLVITGELGKSLLALDAATGSVLYRDDTGGEVGGGVVTYRAAGKQHIAALVGSASYLFPIRTRTRARLVVYALAE